MKKIYSGLFCCCVFLSTASISQTWNGSSSNDWNDAANWTPNNVPTSTGNVIIDNASLSHYPLLPAHVSIRTLTMSAGILNLNGFTLTCSVFATCTGDSLYNGKIVSATFNDFSNMHMGGKIVLEKTGPSNEFWKGNNKFHGDTLIITWRSGGLFMENAALSPDSIFGNLKLVYADNNETTYRINIGVESPIFIQKDLILDNPDKGSFGLDYANEKLIGGNIKATNFSNAVPDFPLKNVIALGSNTNGPFYAHVGSFNNCKFNGDFSFVADSDAVVNIHNSSFLGANNLFQAGNVEAYGNKFGMMGMGMTLLRAAHNLGYNVYMRTGNNKFIGNGQYETYAVYPGGVTVQHNWFGPDTCLQDLSFILKGNAALITNGNGHNYVAGNVVIDGQGARKWIEFSGGSGNTFEVNGNFTAQNFSLLYEPGVTYTSVFLRNLNVTGTGGMGTLYCRSGDIQYSSFKGDLNLVADSNQVFGIYYSSLVGENNLVQAGAIDSHDNQFGQIGSGTTILRGVYNEGGSVGMRDGNNKFFGNAHIETYALYPGSMTIQQTYYGQDSCLGNLNFVLKGNSVLTTNGNGHSYVAGNVTIDGQGARKWVQFGGGSGISFTVDGNFTAKNFTPFSEPGAGPTNVYLHNVYVSGSDTCGTFYCSTGDINNSSFNGNFRLIGDSSNMYYIANSALRGSDNLLQAGCLEAQNSQFGQTGTGTTTLRAAYVGGGYPFLRDGNNKFFGNVSWDTYSPYPGGVTIQQNFYGVDSCLGDMHFILKGNSALTTNGAGNNYVAGNLTIDGQGARKWVQFTGGAGNTFNVGGNFTVKNFTPYSFPGVGNTNIYLHNLNVAGTDTVGTFYCYTGDVNTCNFNGNFKLIADSTQPYGLYNSSFSGVNNLFRAGNLDINNNRFGQPGNGITTFDVSHNVGAPVLMRDGNNKFLHDVDWIAVSPSFGSILIQNTFYGVDTCFGNLALDLSGPASANLAGNELYLGKGLILQNNGSGTIVHSNSASAIHFIGTDTSNYVVSGTGSQPSFTNIEMNRRGGLRLMSPLTYSGTLAFTRGVILSSALNPLQVPNGALVMASWDSSYVDGPVKKVGNTAFTFPLGGNNVYAPLSISAPSSVTDAFTAQYFRHMPHIDGYDTTQHDVSLNHLSRKEYWTLDRTAGSSNVNVTLSWKTLRSGSVTNLSELRVARWNGSSWKDEGNGGTTGNTGEGTIQSVNTISSFSPFTLASTGPSNPLPVRFVSFDARLNLNRTVLVQWTTTSEVNNDHFEIERSTDLVKWTTIQKLNTSYSHKYTYIDINPAEGYNYYRIKQVDLNGDYFYTEIRIVLVETTTEIVLRPNPVLTELNLVLPFSNGSIEIANESGTVLIARKINANHITIPVVQLKAGTYFARITAGDKVYVKKFVKI